MEPHVDVDAEFAWEVIVGFITLAATLFMVGVKIGKKITHLDDTVEHMGERNEDAHDRISVQLERDRKQIRDHEHRITVAETKIETVCEADDE